MVTCLTHGDGIGGGGEGRVGGWMQGVGEGSVKRRGSEHFVFTSWLIGAFGRYQDTCDISTSRLRPHSSRPYF